MDRGDDNGLRDELADDGPSGGRAGERLSVLQYPLLQPAPGARLQRREVVANAVLNLLGVGLLAMPAAMARAGLVSGALVIAATGACMRGSLKLLLATGSSVSGSKSISYPELARQALGPQGLAAVLICHLLYSGGLVTANLVALADVVGQLLQSAGLASETSRILCVLLALAACVLSAVFLHRRANAVLSAACMAGVMILIAALLAVCLVDIVPGSSEDVPPPNMLEDEDVQEVSVDVALFRWNLGGLLAAAALATSQLALHPGCFEVFRDDAGMGVELQENDSHGEEGAYMEGFGSGDRGGACVARGARPRPRLDVGAVLRGSFLAGTLLAVAVGAVGYLRFGNLVAGNVLSSFHAGYGHQGAGLRAAAVLVARLAYGATLTAAAPFAAAPCRAVSLELFATRRGVGGPSVRASRRAYAAVMAATGLLAWLIEDLTMPLSFVGAWAAGPLALTLPTLISLEVSKQQARSAFTSANVRSFGYLVLGVLLMIGSLVSTIIMVFQQPAGHEGHRIVVHNTLDFNMPERNFSMGDNSIEGHVIGAQR